MDRQRKEILYKRDRVCNKTEKEKAIVEKLLPFLQEGKSIGCYIPIGSEVDVYQFLKDRDRLLAPKVVGRSKMIFDRPFKLIPGAYGILEPAQAKDQRVDIMIVPVVGFHECSRMGHGAGYYDTYLKEHDCLKIGVAFDEQEAAFDMQPWDVEMDIMITPTRMFHKTNSSDKK